MKVFPTTRATTAYGYLTAIKKLILAEPKRLNMAVVCLRGAGIERYNQRTFSLNNETPQCGTVGCIAGWSLTLAGRTGADEYNSGNLGTARELLGLSFEQADELFLPSHLVFSANKQTLAHAKATATHIEAFQKRYEHQLKRTKIARVEAA